MSADDSFFDSLPPAERWWLPKAAPFEPSTRWIDPPSEAFIPADDPRYLQLGWGRTPEGHWAPVGVRPDAPLGAWIGGPLGSGKSVLLTQLIRQFLHARSGFLALDGQSFDLGSDTLALIPREREDAVVVFDPEGAEVNGERLVPTLNLLSRSLGISPEAQASLLVSLVAALDPLVEQSPAMQHLVRMALQALIVGEPRPTLWHLARFLGNSAYRARVCRAMADVEQGIVVEPLSTLQQRLTQLLEHPVLAPLLVAPTCTIPIGELMDGGGVILAGASGRDTETVRLGSVALLNQALLASQNRTPPVRLPFHLCLDEAQMFLGDNTVLARMLLPPDLQQPGANLLPDLGALRVGVVVVNQHQTQFDDVVLQALRRLPCQVILGATQEEARQYAQEYSGLGLAPTDFRDQERHIHQRVRLPGLDRLCSVRQLGRPSPCEEPAPEPVEADWRSVRAPAATEEERRLDEAIWVFRDLATQHPDEAIRRLGQLALTEPAAFARYGERTRAHRLAQRAFILANPGAIPDKRERIRTLSALWVGVPVVETRAFRWALEEQVWWSTLPELSGPLPFEPAREPRRSATDLLIDRGEPLCP